MVYTIDFVFSCQLGWLGPQNAYSPSTLIGNWNEKRFDISLLAQSKPLPSQVSPCRMGRLDSIMYIAQVNCYTHLIFLVQSLL